MSDFEIVLYQKQDGTQPVSEFIDSLNVKMQAKVLRSIGLLKQNGYELREPYTKTIQDGILELRIQQGNDIARILYFFVVGRKIVLTNGFIKKTQKTPQRDLDVAIKRYKELLRKSKISTSPSLSYVAENSSFPSTSPRLAHFLITALESKEEK